MDFREWFTQDAVNSFFDKIKNYIASNVSEHGNYISFKLPASQFLTIPQNQAPNPAQSYALAAHTVHSGDLVEGLEKEGGKGKIVYNTAVREKIIKPFNNAPEFQRTLATNISKIGRPMGYCLRLRYLCI